VLTIREEVIMIEPEVPALPRRAPTLDGSLPMIFACVPDVDRRVELAVERGGKVVVPAQNQFLGDRLALIMDPAGTCGPQERTDHCSKILSDQSKM